MSHPRAAETTEAAAEKVTVRRRRRGRCHNTSTRRQRQLTQGNWQLEQKARKRRGRGKGLSLPFALLFPLQREFVHIITHPLAVIVTPVVAFLTAIGTLARITMKSNTGDGVRSPKTVKNGSKLCPLHQGIEAETTPL